MWKERFAFSSAWRQQIEAYVESVGLSLKQIQDHDTPEVKAFLSRRYPAHIAAEICPYDLLQFRKFGHGLVLENQQQEIVGCIFEVGYHTEEKTSYTIRLAVDQPLNGKNLGYHLMVYSSLLAMEQNSRVKRGLIEYNNLQSLYINLNKVGWICDGYSPKITDLGTFFDIALPLDPMGLTANVINGEKLVQYIRERRKGIDYRLVRPGDHQEIQEMYQDTNFKISAVVKPGWLDDQAWLFALPAYALQLQLY
jgi:predicted GNAT family N-acyltransferase